MSVKHKWEITYFLNDRHEETDNIEFRTLISHDTATGKMCGRRVSEWEVENKAGITLEWFEREHERMLRDA